MLVLAQLGKLAAERAASGRKLSQLQLVDAVQHMRIYTNPIEQSCHVFCCEA